MSYKKPEGLSFKEWLDTDVPADEIKYLDPDNKKGEYQPVAVIESLLDNFDVWETECFRCDYHRAIDKAIISGSLELTVTINGPVGLHGEAAPYYSITRTGAATMILTGKDENMDYEATILSLALVNAAKRLGKRFGRALNGRLEKGETLNTIDRERQRKMDQAIDEVNTAGDDAELIRLHDIIYKEFQPEREFSQAVANRKQYFILKKGKKKDE